MGNAMRKISGKGPKKSEGRHKKRGRNKGKDGEEGASAATTGSRRLPPDILTEEEIEDIQVGGTKRKIGSFLLFCKYRGVRL